MKLESRLVDHASGVGVGDVPTEAVEAARRAILWTLGSMVAGSRDRGSDTVMRTVEALAHGATGPATIIGGGTGHRPVHAGFANGVWAKALEYEDKHWMGSSHAYAVAVAVVPAAFAIAEHVGGVTGAELLTAVAVATDVEMRIIDAAPHAIDTPFNSTYVMGHFGAALAVGKVLGLKGRSLSDALGLAFTQAAGSFQAHHEGSLAVRMQMGFCVRNGIYAGLMAKAGIEAPQQFLTGRHGLFPAYFGECDEEAALSGLGKRFMGTRLGFKGHPCCAAMHQAMDAVREVREREQVTPEEVVRVVVHGAPSMAITCRPIEAKQDPQNHVEQSFSLPWATACMLTGDRLTLADFREEALADPTRQTLARKVFAELDAPDDGVHVVMTLAEGREVRSRPVDAPSGHPDNPHSMEGIIDRYREFVRHGPGHLRGEPAERAMKIVLEMEEAGGAAAAIQLLA